MRFCDWSSDVCSSDLAAGADGVRAGRCDRVRTAVGGGQVAVRRARPVDPARRLAARAAGPGGGDGRAAGFRRAAGAGAAPGVGAAGRSEERRVGKSVSVRVDLGGRRIIKKKKKEKISDII